jgi:hypothetical protein
VGGSQLVLLPSAQSGKKAKHVRYPADADVVGRVTAVTMCIAELQRCSSLRQTLHSHSAALHNCKLKNVSRFTEVTDRGGSRHKCRRGSEHVVYDRWVKLEADPALGVSSGDTVLNELSRTDPMLDLD